MGVMVIVCTRQDGPEHVLPVPTGTLQIWKLTDESVLGSSPAAALKHTFKTGHRKTFLSILTSRLPDLEYL